MLYLRKLARRVLAAGAVVALAVAGTGIASPTRAATPPPALAQPDLSTGSRPGPSGSIHGLHRGPEAARPIASERLAFLD